MSSGFGWEGGFGPGVEVAVDDVGEVALGCSAGLAAGFAFGAFPFEVGAGVGVDADLGDGDAVDCGVELAVAAAVEAVSARGFAGAAGDWGDAAEAGAGSLVAEAADVFGVRDQRDCDDRAGADEVCDRLQSVATLRSRSRL